MEQIKIGDIVRVSEEAPSLYTDGWFYKWMENDSSVWGINGEDALIGAPDDCNSVLAIPTKYLIKVGGEKKEQTIKVGDNVLAMRTDQITPSSEINTFRRNVSLVTKIKDGIASLYYIDGYGGNHYARTAVEFLQKVPTEPTPQADDAERKPRFHFGDIVCYGEIGEPMRSGRVISERNPNNNLYAVCSGIEIFHVYEEALNPYDPIKDGYISPIKREPRDIDNTDWTAYIADLAKELAVKLVGSTNFRDAKEKAAYVVDYATEIVENLKRDLLCE